MTGAEPIVGYSRTVTDHTPPQWRSGRRRAIAGRNLEELQATVAAKVVAIEKCPRNCARLKTLRTQLANAKKRLHETRLARHQLRLEGMSEDDRARINKLNASARLAGMEPMLLDLHDLMPADDGGAGS